MHVLAYNIYIVALVAEIPLAGAGIFIYYLVALVVESPLGGVGIFIYYIVASVAETPLGGRADLYIIQWLW